jgi:hypothetical protein
MVLGAKPGLGCGAGLAKGLFSIHGHGEPSKVTLETFGLGGFSMGVFFEGRFGGGFLGGQGRLSRAGAEFGRFSVGEAAGLGPGGRAIKRKKFISGFDLF